MQIEHTGPSLADFNFTLRINNGMMIDQVRQNIVLFPETLRVVSSLILKEYQQGSRCREIKTVYHQGQKFFALVLGEIL